MSLFNKKLLVLGGTMLSCEIVKAAKEQGAVVYVTDYLDESPAKKIADKSFMVSTIDVDAVVNLIAQEKIDGVLTGFVDMLLPYYFDICKKADIPCYISSKEQIHKVTEKDKFKELCRKFDVPVVEEYAVKAPFTIENTRDMKFPVLIKPVDNSGARGVYICNSLEDLQEKYPKSLEFSKSKTILIERYVNAKEATVFYLIQDGEIRLSAMGDRHVKKFQEGVIPLPVAYTFPSKKLPKYQEEIDEKVIAMFRSIGVENGMAFIQLFTEEDGFIVYEMGYRLTGSLEYKIIEEFNGINPLTCMVNHALTARMSDDKFLVQKLNPNPKRLGANITLLANPGRIAKIEGVEEITRHPKILDVVTSYEVGESIPSNALGTLQQVVARVFLVSDSKEELVDLFNLVGRTIKVENEFGNSLLIDGVDFNEL